jgi:hypothetical protein
MKTGGQEMPCETLVNEKDEVIGWACGGSWGMGIKYHPDMEGTEFESTYGYGGSGDPHDFSPDYECNTTEEIKAWEAAKETCQCGR